MYVAIFHNDPPRSCSECKQTLCVKDLPPDFEEWREHAFIATRKAENREHRHPDCPFLRVYDWESTVEPYTGRIDMTLHAVAWKDCTKNHF